MSYKLAMNFCVYLLAALHLTYGQVSEGIPCETPDQEYGTCINIKSCTPLVTLLQTQSGNPETVNFLRKSVCGYIERVPMVCCPQLKPKSVNPFAENTDNKENQAEPTEPLYKLPEPPNCGLSNLSIPRIVNGVPAKLGEFPWIVALGYRNAKNPQQPKWLCGGAMITKKHVLTAAHCVHNRNDLYLARVGELDLYVDTEGAHPQDIPLIKARIHEDYSPTTFINDIAILTLESEPTVENVWPVCLPIREPLRSEILDRIVAIVAGWGSIYFHGPSSSTLQLTRIPVVTNEQCKRAYANRSIIDDRVLCAGLLQGGTDACEGDSGGALIRGIVEGRQIRFYEVGVVSYGFRCAEPGYPGVYTRVTAFLEWIQRNLD